MTQEETLNHPQYFNSKYTFPGEEWQQIKYKDCTRYWKSTYYRIKNMDTGHILKPISQGRFRSLSVSLYGDNKKPNCILFSTLFKDFTFKEEYHEFIYDAF